MDKVEEVLLARKRELRRGSHGMGRTRNRAVRLGSFLGFIYLVFVALIYICVYNIFIIILYLHTKVDIFGHTHGKN